MRADPDMLAAVQAVRTRGMAVREAARKYNVPRSTLQRKVQRAEAHSSEHGGKDDTRKGGADQPRRATTIHARDRDRELAPTTTKREVVETVARGRQGKRVSVSSGEDSPVDATDSGTRPREAPRPCAETMEVAQAMIEGAGMSQSKQPVSLVALLTTPMNEAGHVDVKRDNDGRTRGPRAPAPHGRKRSADEMQGAARATRSTSSSQLQSTVASRVKGPRKAINGKIRMLCHSAGSALDELSNTLIREGKCVYKLGLGQSPFPVPQCIVDELRANAHQRDYLPVAGLPELCSDIAAWGARSLAQPYTPDDVIVGPGTKELLFVLQTVYYGDLLLPNPGCMSFGPQANIAGRNMFWLPTSAEDGWVLRPEAIEEHCRKDPDAPRILILNSPSNPTGCVYTKEELQAVADVARKYRMLVISDELYSELHHHSGTHHSISAMYPEGTIVSGGLSKWCGAGGWRMGFWLFPASMSWLRKSMLVMASETYTSVAAPIQYAARRAFVPDCIELASYKKKCCTILSIIGKWCVHELRKVCVEVQPPRGGFYLFPSLASHRHVLAARGILTDTALCEQLLHDTGVAILPGSAFGRDPHELFVRLAFIHFKGDIALYLIESLDNFGLDAINGFVESVCPNVAIAVRKLAGWISGPAPILSKHYLPSHPERLASTQMIPAMDSTAPVPTSTPLSMMELLTSATADK